jgi:AcrR family transcriptional regulator
VKRERASSKTATPRRSGTPAADSPARARIFEAASKLIREQGPSAATARAICDAAGLKAPTLYHYFGDLDGLYTEILESMFLEYLADSPPDEIENPAAMIADYWTRAMSNAREEPGIIDLLNRQLSTGRVPEIMFSSYRRLEMAFEQLSKTKPMKVKPRMAAHMFWAATHGMTCLIVASRHGVTYPEGAAEALKSTMLEGLFGVQSLDGL